MTKYFVFGLALIGLGCQVLPPPNNTEQAARVDAVEVAQAAKPNQEPYEEKGVKTLPLSDFEVEEQMWVGYDNIGYIELNPGAEGPAGHFHLGSVHPPYEGRWYRIAAGHEFAGEQVKSGKQSLKWFDTTVSSRIVTASIPHDWSQYTFLSLWIFSEKANRAAIELVCYSEDVNSPDDDYYKKEIVIDWEGWKLIEIPFDKFTPTRKPLVWDRITYIKIASTGWGHTAMTDTVLHLDDLKLTDKSIAPDPLEKIQIAFADTPHPYLFGGSELYREVKEKIARYGWARDAYTALKQTGDILLSETIRVPEQGGGFYHDIEQAADYAITEEHYRLSRGARILAILYQLDGNPAYANQARKILLKYADAYKSYELHDKYGNFGSQAATGGRATAQSINEAKWVIPLAWAYDLIYDTFTTLERERIEKELFREAASIIGNNNEGKHNHQAWYNAGVGVIGFLLRDPAYVKYAVYGPDNGFLFQMSSSLSEEGMWYEGSGHYHFYTMEPLLALSEAAYFSGLNLYANDKFKKYFRFPVLYANPQGELPIINDGRRVELTENDRARFLEIAYTRYGDPLLAEVLSNSLRGSLEALLYGTDEIHRTREEQNRSVLLGGSLAVLRSPGERLYATLNGRPYTGGHSHYDKLSITVYADGRIIAPDSGSIKYRDPAYEGYFKQTVAHNTVVQDWSSQEYVGAAESLFFARGPLAQLTWLKDTAAYPGTVQSRALLITDWYLLDLFDLVSEKAHTFHWIYRNYGRLEVPVMLTPAHMPASGGFSYLERPTAAELSNALELVWDMYGTEVLTLNVLPSGQRSRLITADVPVAARTGDEIDPRRYRAVLLERDSDSTLFVSLIIPGRRPGEFVLKQIPLGSAGQTGGGSDKTTVAQSGPTPERAGAFILSESAAAPEDLVIYNTGPYEDLEAGSWKTDARIALIRAESGKPVEVFAGGASYLTGPGLSLQFGPGIAGIRQPESLLHFSFNAEEITIFNQQPSRILIKISGDKMENFRFASPEGELQEVSREPGSVTLIAGPPKYMEER